VEKRDKLAKELDQVTRLRDDASGQAEGLRVDLELAQDGQVGLAGLIIRTLRDAPKPVSAVSLAEATTLAPATRPLWEARLAPWRDAVCIARADLPVALSALATMPGAILITPGASADSMAAAGSSAGTLPDGVLSSPPEAISLLHSLAEHMAVPTPVPYSTDARTGIHVVGGFEVPIVGGEDIRDHLGRRHGAVQVQLASLNQDVKTLGIQLEHAIITAGCAEAAERVATLAPEVANLAEKLAIHQNTVLPPLTTSRNDAWTAHGDAERALATREDTLNQLSDEILSLRGDLRGQAAAIERFTSASRPDDVVLAAWAKGKDAARAALGWPEKADPGIPDRIRDEAPAPAVDEASGAIERRRATALGDAARVHLSGALTALEYHGKGTGAPPSDLRSVAHRYVKFQDSDGEDLDGSLFETTLASFHSWLEDEADRDRAAPEQVAQARATRAETTEFVTSEVGKLDEALRETQQAITQRAAGALERISTELNRLNRESDGGLGARLDCDIIPPATPDQGWICRVTPRWRRNPSGPMLPYDNVTNTAQEKLFSIHLVLAALLAAPNPCGRVLILDELADSLGAEHRREVLDAITTVAKAHGITVLATCQDAILAEARPYCGEILYFNYPSKSEPLNRPTRVFGVDPDGARVELTAEAVIEGRNPM